MTLGPELGDEGDVVDGRYQLLERLGSGGMAEVFGAQDLQLGRKVALKLLYRRFAEDAEFVERFRREASHAAGLQHPNVVSVYDRGEWDGTYYIAMEYLEGRSLKDLVLERGALPLEEAIDVTIQVLRAAKFAHKRGVIHRDLKPHNVIVDESDPAHPRVKVTDFGIARAGASDMTETGSIMGTAQYLSPEQAQGHQTSARSDLYSIGIMLYELVTGELPFDGESAVTIALKQVSEQPRTPSQINPAVGPEIDGVILRALAKAPEDRQADAEHFIAELEAARGHLADPAAVPPPPVGDPPGPWTGEEQAWSPPPAEEPREGSNRGWLWALALGLLVAGVAVAALLLTGKEQVRVPDVVGASLAAASQRLERDGFAVETIRDNSQRPRNQVIGQSPSARERVEKGSTVRLTVSDGPGTAAVPDVVDRRRLAAVAALEDAGFKVKEARRASDDVKQNFIIETRPEGGTQAAVGTTVTLVVSTGPARVAAPGVVGQDEDEARATLEEAGFTVARQEQETDATPAGRVLSQNPADGVRARKGSRVSIVVATEPPPVIVPDVTGGSEAAARRALAAAGFRVATRTREVQTPDEDGIVVAQSPSGDSDSEQGASVEITIGRFEPDLDPDPDPSTTTTPATTTPATTTPEIP